MFVGDIPESVIKAALKPNSIAAEVFFSKGDVVQGEVIKAISADKALVNIGGVEMIAQTKVKLMDGQKLTGVVDNTSPITISLLKDGTGKDAKIAELTRMLLPGKKPVGEVLAKVLEIGSRPNSPAVVKEVMAELGPKLENAILKNLSSLTPDQAKVAIKNSGLFLESTLKSEVMAQLNKPNVAAPVQNVSQEAATLSDLKAWLSKALKSIETVISVRTAELKTPSSAKQSSSGQTVAPEVLLPQKKDVPVNLSDKGSEVADRRAVTKTVVEDQGSTKQPLPTDPRLEQLGQLRDAAKSLRDALSNIELNQLMNAVSKESAAGQPKATPQFLYQLPFIDGDFVKNARVYVNPDGGGAGSVDKKKRGENAIVFMLDMTKLGPVRVDARIGGSRITGSVFVANDIIANYVNSKLPELLEPLRNEGYNVWFDVNVASNKKLTEELETETPLTVKGLINIKA